MVNDLQELLRSNVASPPPDDLDLTALVGSGRQRVRRRRTIAAATALATVAIVAAAALAVPRGSDKTEPAHPLPAHLKVTDSERAVEGRDYDVLTSYTNKDLGLGDGSPRPSGKGQFFDGVTEDGLVLFRDGSRRALLDPDGGAKDWLPDDGAPPSSASPVELSADRLVLVNTDDTDLRLSAYLFDRKSRQWTTVTWPGLPDGGDMQVALGPDGRLYVPIQVTETTSLPGTEVAGKAQAPATYHLWSVSLTDGSDARDEGLTVGAFALTDSAMLWTDGIWGDPGLVHVRDLSSGAERSFDPRVGADCDLMGLSASTERIVLSSECENWTSNFIDGRVQVFGTDGAPVTTIAQPGVVLGGAILPGGRIVEISVQDWTYGGTLVLDLKTNRLLRISDAITQWSAYSGATGTGDQFFLQTPVDDDKGATQWMSRLRD